MLSKTMHPCEILYSLHGDGFTVGVTSGTCRITGKQSTGMQFSKWVKDTFTDHAYLYPGTIISNEAAFCFDEASELIKQKTGRDKLQRFRTYSHIVTQDGNWHIVTKADKEKIVSLLQENPQIVCLTETGQKHVFFKHRIGYWQLDETHIQRDLDLFNELHQSMMRLLGMGFSQKEIILGKYSPGRVFKAGFDAWDSVEHQIKAYRKTPIFDFASFLMYSIKQDSNE